MEKRCLSISYVPHNFITGGGGGGGGGLFPLPPAAPDLATFHHIIATIFYLADIQGDADKLLFRGLTSTKQGYRLRPSGGINFTRVRGLVLEKTTGVRFGPKVVRPSQP